MNRNKIASSHCYSAIEWTNSTIQRPYFFLMKRNRKLVHSSVKKVAVNYHHSYIAVAIDKWRHIRILYIWIIQNIFLARKKNSVLFRKLPQKKCVNSNVDQNCANNLISSAGLSKPNNCAEQCDIVYRSCYLRPYSVPCLCLMRTCVLLCPFPCLRLWLSGFYFIFLWLTVIFMLILMVSPSLNPKSSSGRGETFSWSIFSWFLTHLKWSCSATFKSNESDRSPKPRPKNAVRPKEK